jgi:hypothetical protein
MQKIWREATINSQVNGFLCFIIDSISSMGGVDVNSYTFQGSMYTILENL